MFEIGKVAGFLGEAKGTQIVHCGPHAALLTIVIMVYEQTLMALTLLSGKTDSHDTHAPLKLSSGEVRFSGQNCLWQN